MPPPSPSSSDSLAAGLACCRRGEWHAGRAHLERLRGADSIDERARALTLAFLGQAAARCDRDLEEALRLCERAAESGFLEPEVWWNLAWVRLLRTEKKQAVDALERGLKAEPRSALLRNLHRRLGVRRPPVVPFLARSHPLNLALGLRRHRLEQARARD